MIGAFSTNIAVKPVRLKSELWWQANISLLDHNEKDNHAPIVAMAHARLPGKAVVFALEVLAKKLRDLEWRGHQCYVGKLDVDKLPEIDVVAK